MRFSAGNGSERNAMNKDIVCAYLDANCTGKKNVIPSQRLEQELHMSGNEIRKQINALRREAVPIASNGSGYFYAENAAEVYTTIRSLQKMRRGLDAAIAGLEQALEKFGGEP